MAIIRGTTPTLTFHIKNNQIDLNEVAQVWITFKTKAGVKVVEQTYDREDVTIDTEEHTIELFLSQEDTLALTDKTMLLQMRMRLNNDLAYASSISEVEIGQILKDGVI